ncbi:MAG: hypothetical protein E4G91_05100 [Candidatus Zixiibacteriota bacterium]|nr:MAG: hypothetical protein E4G91_05100 [candidate division Zixibacteria bacterium]
MKMLNQRRAAIGQSDQTQQVWKEARKIESILKQIGRSGLLDDSSPGNLKRIASVRQCVKDASIIESKWTRGETSLGRPQKDGSSIYTETNSFKNIRLLQIAMFIDSMERYSSVRCDSVTNKPSNNKKNDSWDADIKFKYFNAGSRSSET